MNNYHRIERWMQRVIDAIDPNRFFAGPLADREDLARLEYRIKESGDIWWGWGGPSLTSEGIFMPCEKEDCSVRLVGALAHEYGHVRQRAEGRLLPRWNYTVNRALLMEELDATIIGTRLLLDLDMWHPQHGFVLAIAWFGYLAGWVQDWAHRKWESTRWTIVKNAALKQETLEEGITLIDEAVLAGVRDEAVLIGDLKT